MGKNLVVIAVVFLSACDQGVPKVDDPHNVIVDGKKMTQSAFLHKYCVEQVADPTCSKVKHAMLLDFTKGEVPRF